MDLQAVLTEIDYWPIEDRIQLVQEIWDRLAEGGHEPEWSDAMKAAFALSLWEFAGPARSMKRLLRLLPEARDDCVKDGQLSEVGGQFASLRRFLDASVRWPASRGYGVP